MLKLTLEKKNITKRYFSKAPPQNHFKQNQVCEIFCYSRNTKTSNDKSGLSLIQRSPSIEVHRHQGCWWMAVDGSTKRGTYSKMPKQLVPQLFLFEANPYDSGSKKGYLRYPEVPLRFGKRNKISKTNVIPPIVSSLRKRITSVDHIHTSDSKAFDLQSHLHPTASSVGSRSNEGGRVHVPTSRSTSCRSPTGGLLVAVFSEGDYAGRKTWKNHRSRPITPFVWTISGILI